MSEDLIIASGSKTEQYENLLPQIEALVAHEDDVIANLANVAAALKQQFDWLWVGFYLVKDGDLVVGPFQGPIACTRIQKGKGVCGSSWESGKTIVVEDVNKFPGHIACSSLSKSEIVVPVFKDGEVIAVLDADDDEFSSFDKTDQQYLERICAMVGGLFAG